MTLPCRFPWLLTQFRIYKGLRHPPLFSAFSRNYSQTTLSKTDQSQAANAPLPSHGYANQNISTECNVSLKNFESLFPTDSIKYSFGYGLGVFPQKGYGTAKKPQIDVVHVVDSPQRFHEINTAQFPGHYSFLRLFGVSAIVKVQEYGAGVYYNPYVSISDESGNSNMIKYGVVSTDVVFRDLMEWTSFYLAGRLQKPVRHAFGTDLRLKQANQYNLQSALNLSLMLLALGRKKITSKKDLYVKIALLSYMGDPRMLVGGENPNKVKNIVDRQMLYFEQLYAPALTAATDMGFVSVDLDTLNVSKEPVHFATIISSLPLNFRSRLAQSYSKKYSQEYGPDAVSDPSSKFVQAVSRDIYLRRALLTTVLAITAYPALVQSLKGILTAGVVKSAKYAWEKRMKSMARN